MQTFKRFFLFIGIPLLSIGISSWLFFSWVTSQEENDERHFTHSETELIVSPLTQCSVELFKAGTNLLNTTRIPEFNGQSMWLPQGDYFLKATFPTFTTFIPVPLNGYRSGPDKDGSFVVTLRTPPRQLPPRLFASFPEFVYIPGGSFLFGDQFNPREPHYVWLTGFFLYPFEVTNAEFREFLIDTEGYTNDANWTDEGKQWKASHVSQVSALLKENSASFRRFGQSDQPVTWINWFEANAFCKWLTKKIGGGRWLFDLPNEAEWEKAARGPDGFDYALANTLSDNEVTLYNWKKNLDANVIVVGIQESQKIYQPNRFGLYHMTGNVVEWTRSIHRPFNREHPFSDDDRNKDNTAGLRVARGGSWYSASIAYLYIPYRDAFQPEHSTQDIGFRIVARIIP